MKCLQEILSEKITFSWDIWNEKANHLEVWERDFQVEGIVSANVWSRQAQWVHEAGRKSMVWKWNEWEYLEWGHRGRQGLIQVEPYWTWLMGNFWKVWSRKACDCILAAAWRIVLKDQHGNKGYCHLLYFKPHTLNTLSGA